jgi:dCTP deaminase
VILSDREIIAALKRQFVRITPEPEPSNPDIWSSTAIDLRLDAKLEVWNPPTGPGVHSTIDPADPEFNVTALARTLATTADCSNGFEIVPGMFLLGWTLEKIQLPYTSRIAARVEGKSSLARIGIGVHVTAPTIHAGFGYRPGDPTFPGNPIQLEIWNVGPLTVRLVEGMRICQLIFEEVHGTPNKGYDGRFSIQGPDIPPLP